MHSAITTYQPPDDDRPRQSTSPPSIATCAVDYHARGWSVIPLRGKRPSIASWSQYQHHHPTTSDLRRWFSITDTNLGIITGRLSGLVVVDCDTWQDAQFWEQQFPPTPLRSSTGGGGVHYYYRYPKVYEVRNRVGLWARRIDLRGDGGYVVAPPSTHPNGNTYSWQENREATFDGVPVFSPFWIANDDSGLHESQTTRSVRFPTSYLRTIRAVSGERGHDATFRAACILRDAGMTPEESLCELAIWNQSNADPPWSMRELLHKVQSAFASRTDCSAVWDDNKTQ